jgi:hypothetical protein
LYIITAWDQTRETTVRAPDASEALTMARELVNQGLRVSIVRTSDGQALAFTELQEDAEDAQRSERTRAW